MNLEDTMKDIIEEQGLDYTEKVRTLYTTCPSCDRSDKLSILKDNGATICYHGGCDFGRSWFQDWLAQTAGITIQDAKKRIYGERIKHIDRLPTKLELNSEKKIVLEKLEYPISGFLDIDDAEAHEGAMYLEHRGVSTELAKHYDIKYSPWFRRVVLPIKMGGSVYGWQARAIDKVDALDRMRNNEGFRKDQLLMFHDNLYLHKSAMLFEGPFDALKFHPFGGIVCSMGKNVSKKQVDLINESPVEVVYLGLDPDATEELRGLTKSIEKKMKILTIPQSCEIRCEKSGKKADFGECSFLEIKEAFETAKDFSDGHVFIHLKKFF